MSNESKIFLQALKGQKTKEIPFWFMRQAGRYLLEYRELRARKNGFMDMALDPQAACEITMQPIRRFEMSAAIIFSDILMVPYGLGMDVDFIAGEGPKLNALDNGKDLDRLDSGAFSKLEPVYHALQQTRAALQDEGYANTALIGFAGAPWTVATYMVEGGSSRDFHKTKCWACSDPESFQKLIDMITQATADYLIKQIEAGAEALQLFDSWSGVLDAAGFERWCVKPAKDIITRVKAAYPEIPIIGFPKGAGANAMTYLSETGIDALGLDSSLPLQFARDFLQPHKPVQGNLDPHLLLAGGEAMVQAAREICDTLAPFPFIFNLGHGIHKDTPVAHVEALVEFLKIYERP